MKALEDTRYEINDPNRYVVTHESKLRIPSGQKVTYEANDEGIVKVTETFDQDGESLYESNQMIISKEAFVEAYKKYIEDGEI